MVLIPIPKSGQNLNSVRNRRLFDVDWLESTLESGIFLKVLPVFVKGRGTDRLKFAAGKHWFEDACSIDGTFGGTCSDESVDLVDEQNDVASSADLFQDLLQALFEITAVTATGNERAKIEGVDLLVFESLRDFAFDDCLCKTFYNSSFPNARLTDQDRIVLRATRENLHDAFDFFLASNNWIEFSFAGSLGEVATELVEHERSRRRSFSRSTCGGALLALVVGEKLDHLLADAVQVGAQLHQHLGSHAFAFADQAKQYVLGADVIVSKLERLAEGELKHFLGSWSKRNVTAWSLLALPDDLFNLRADSL
ncbi:hypothetical protein GALL_442780 [mine drainage metagenome]|uniref:Uncharacterized protein n=1 Tax=mine drainage metagenome TaxID=410659 RepID=A0A1J5Q253_9ZZZZ